VEDPEHSVTRALDAHMAFGDQRGIAQTRRLLRMLQPFSPHAQLTTGMMASVTESGSCILTLGCRSNRVN
jgi:hypothetical protein